ncbi:adenylate cyclase [Staphylococcus microti]|uniref:Adenylate cyclase n=1 Tax=Staphylococcus microti TaxID=569857 RepID=A0A0D6XQ46_9STAP|nr:CYTH domain-containing protein [Staphylococcus microti]KIX90545.1 adenylate cyclase [Staphylococcus microti]PNZ81978.1 CYTH domain-containing protein [Staphylococcus microti]SUM56984.1 adenylate cyclase [Staphylococcus microti]
MAIEREIEFKQLLDQQTYNDMKQTYFPNSEPFTQTNYYIDTPDFQIMQHKMALRIRVRQDKPNEITLKVPAAVGLTEYNHSTTHTPQQDASMPESVLTNDIIDVLRRHYIDTSQLIVLGSLTTHRLETSQTDGLLVLDHSEYLGAEDFELEFEVADYETGYHAFKNILATYELEHQAPLNKVQRFFERRQKMS